MIKVSLFKQEFHVYMDMIYSIIPCKKLILMRKDVHYRNMSCAPNHPLAKQFYPVIIPEQRMFDRIKFEWVKYLRTMKDPEDRVATFEYEDENGVADFAKYAELVEARKTRIEKQKEVDEQIEFISKCEEMNLDCQFMKDNLKEKLTRR